MKQVQCALLAMVWALGACSVGPDYRRPASMAARTASYANAPEDVKAVVEAGDFSRWWERMDDNWMDAHVSRLIEENLQLKEAAARIQQAYAQLGIEKGDRLPSLAASASATRRTQSVGTFTTTTAAFPGQVEDRRIYFTQIEAGLNTSWQLDLFGKVRQRIAAAEDRYLASRAEAEGLIHSLIAQLARGRIALSTVKRRLELVEEIVESRELTLDTVERRYRLGVERTSAGDVYLARENLAAAAADLPNLRRQLFEQAYALDVLLGLQPGTIEPLEVRIAVMPPPLDAPVGVPAGLIDRRPDLQAAELRLMAEVEEIGVAVANLYPDLTLSGNVGLQENELEDFFDGSSLVAAITGDVLLRLFEGGRLRANIDLQEAQARQQAAAYAQQVLNALEEVEVALSDTRFLAERIEALQNRLVNIRKAEAEAWEKYRKGLSPLLEVLEVQRRRYVAEQQYLLAAQAAWNNRIALYLALGGDWLDAPPVLEPLPVPSDANDE